MHKIHSDTYNLGDCLQLTPILHHFKGNCKVLFPNAPEIKSEVPLLFENICPVEKYEIPPSIDAPQSNVMLPKAQRILHHFGLLGKVSAAPKITIDSESVKKEVSELYKSLLFKYKKRIIIIKTNDKVLSERTPKPEIFKNFIEQNLENSVFVRVSRAGEKKTLEEGIVDIELPSLIHTAYFYQLSGTYVGPDTGDYHLMVAVGGFCLTFVPKETQTYLYALHHYNDFSWIGEAARVKYITFNE